LILGALRLSAFICQNTGFVIDAPTGASLLGTGYIAAAIQPEDFIIHTRRTVLPVIGCTDAVQTFFTIFAVSV
jgi:hypothetical protein